MAIAVQIIPPARAGVNAKNSTTQATAAFGNDMVARRHRPFCGSEYHNPNAQMRAPSADTSQEAETTWTSAINTTADQEQSIRNVAPC
jgi:hypothetical protein